MAVARVPPERSQLAAELLLAQFSKKDHDDIGEAAATLGDGGASALREASAEVRAAAEILTENIDVKARWSAIVCDIKAKLDEDADAPPAAITLAERAVAAANQAKISLLSSAAVVSLIKTAGRLRAKASSATSTASTGAKAGAIKGRASLSKAASKGRASLSSAAHTA